MPSNATLEIKQRSCSQAYLVKRGRAGRIKELNGGRYYRRLKILALRPFSTVVGHHVLAVIQSRHAASSMIIQGTGGYVA